MKKSKKFEEAAKKVEKHKLYTKEEAMAEFKPFQGTTQKGYPYTGYEYGGQKYHDVAYVGEFEDNKMPHSDIELMDALIKSKK